MKPTGIFPCLLCLGLAVPARGAEILQYSLMPGSTITPYWGSSPVGSTEPLTGQFAWVQYDSGSSYFTAFNAVSLSFRSASRTLELDWTPRNDVGTSMRTDTPLTWFAEVADLTGLALDVGYVSSLSPGTYLGPPDRPIVVTYPNVWITPLGGGLFHGRLQLVARRDGVANVAPSFTKGTDVEVWVDSGPDLVPNWATHISPGPPSEAGQRLWFVLSCDNPGLFSEPPALDQNGTLSFTPAPQHSGVARLTVVLQDDGGTAYWGQDTSAPETFTITVLTPRQAVLRLALDVQEADLGRLNTQPLLATLEAAYAAFDRDHWAAGVNHLETFQRRVRTQVARVSPGLAAQWIAEAQATIDFLAGVWERSASLRQAPAASSTWAK